MQLNISKIKILIKYIIKMSLLLSPTLTLTTASIDLLSDEKARKVYLNTMYYPRSITMPRYENLNYNLKTQKRIIKYFYYKTLEKWLYDDLDHLLKFLKIEKGKVVLVKSIDEYEKARDKIDSEEHKDVKVDFIAKYLLSKSKIGDILYKFTKEYGISWIRLYRHRRKVRKFIGKKLKNKFIKSIRQMK